MEMNTIIEITDKIGLDYYFVTLTLNHDKLEIKNTHSKIKKIQRELSISKIEEVTLTHRFGAKTLNFHYKNEFFSIVDCGTNIVPFLEAVFINKIV